MLPDDHVEQAVSVDVPERYAGRGIVAFHPAPIERPGAAGRLAELSRAVVEEEPVPPVAAGNEDVGPGIVVDVGGGHAESGDARRQTGRFRRVLELEASPVTEQTRGPSALVHGEAAVSDEKIQEAIAVEVERRRAPSGESRARTGPVSRGNIGESAAAVVAEERAGRERAALEHAGHAGHVEIEVAIVVEVGEEAGVGPRGETQMLLVVELELAAGIAEKHVGLRPLGMKGAHVQVDPAVAVDVAPARGVSADARGMR